MSKAPVQCEFYVEGMHCASCELLLEKKLATAHGVTSVDAELSKHTVQIIASTDKTASQLQEELNALIKEDGYQLALKPIPHEKVNIKELGLGFFVALAIIILFAVLERSGVLQVFGDELTYPMVFTIGIIASISSCMAVVGGMVLSLTASLAKGGKTGAIIGFHVSRLMSLFVLGGIMGMMGSVFQTSPTISFTVELLLFAVMLAMGVNMLQVFHFQQLSLPKVFGKLPLRIANMHTTVAPILLGAVTFILPCGFTQSMQLQALATGTFWGGAMLMLVFALGTLPLLALVSVASAKFSKSLQSGLFYKASGFLIIMFAFLDLYGVLVTTGMVRPFIW